MQVCSWATARAPCLSREFGVTRQPVREALAETRAKAPGVGEEQGCDEAHPPSPRVLASWASRHAGITAAEERWDGTSATGGLGGYSPNAVNGDTPAARWAGT